MPRKLIDPDVVASGIKKAIEESTRRTRHTLCHRLVAEFGFKHRNATRDRFITDTLARYGIEVTPAIADVGPHEWLILRLKADQPVIPETAHASAPSSHWFQHLTSVQLHTEKEVELHFVSPLFRQLGYSEEQEAAGVPVEFWEGVKHRRTEADFVYFASSNHDLTTGNPLVLVECKDATVDVLTGIGQVRSYTFWVKPAYYVVTNGHQLKAFLYLGGPVQDKQVLDLRRQDLEAEFSNVQKYLGYEAAFEAKKQLQAHFEGPPQVDGLTGG